MSFRIDNGKNIKANATTDKKAYAKQEVKVPIGKNQYSDLPETELTIAKEFIEDRIAMLKTDIQKLKLKNNDPEKIKNTQNEIKQLEQELKGLNQELKNRKVSAEKSLNTKG